MKNNKALKLAFHFYSLQGIVFHSPYHETRVICLTRDKIAYHHQSNVPPQPLVCPRLDGRDGRKKGLGG